MPCPAGFAPGAPAYLLQPLQAPSQLTNLPPQGAFILFRFPNWDKGEPDHRPGPATGLALPVAHTPAYHLPR